jgi:hypothetical protein
VIDPGCPMRRADAVVRPFQVIGSESLAAQPRVDALGDGERTRGQRRRELDAGHGRSVGEEAPVRLEDAHVL